MKLHLSWKTSNAGFYPSCNSDVLNKDGIDLLACLLTDDGGQRLNETVSWLNEGVVRVSLVKNSILDFSSWSRDAWGAELSKERVKIYSLYDDSYFTTMSLDVFENALLAWKDFIQQPVSIEMSQTLEI
jgi:hypothetical protein